MATRDLVLRIVVENQQANTALANYNNAIKTAASQQQQMQGGIAGLNQGFNQLQGVLNATVLGFSAMKLVDVIGDLNQLGQKVNIAQEVFTQLAGGEKQAADMLALMRAETQGIVTDFDLMGNANRLLQMQLATTADDAARLTTLAVQLGSSMGMGTEKALSDFNLLLANNSFLRLDQFGIAAGGVRTRVNELKEEFPELTREARFSMAVLEAGEGALDRLGGAADAAATNVRKVETHLENLRQTIAEMINDVAEDVAGGVVGYLDSQEALWLERERIAARAIDLAEEWNATVEGFNPEHLSSRTIEDFQTINEVILNMRRGAGGAMPSADAVMAQFIPGTQDIRAVTFALEHQFDLDQQITAELEQQNYEYARMEQAIANMGASNIADTTAGLQGLSDLFTSGTAGFMGTLRDFAEVLPERENPFELWADSLENAREQAAEIREETEAAAQALRDMQSTGVMVDRAGNKPVDQYDVDKNLIVPENLVSVTSNESGGMKPEEKSKFAEYAYGAAAQADAEAYTVGVRSTVWDMIMQALGTEQNSFRLGEASTAWDTPMPERASIWDVMMQEASAQQHDFRMGEAGGSFDGAALADSLGEAAEPMSVIADGFQTAGDNAAIMEAAMGSVRDFAGEALGTMTQMSQMLQALQRGPQDIGVRLVLDESHFRIALSNAMSFFQIANGMR